MDAFFALSGALRARAEIIRDIQSSAGSECAISPVIIERLSAKLAVLDLIVSRFPKAARKPGTWKWKPRNLRLLR